MTISASISKDIKNKYKNVSSQFSKGLQMGLNNPNLIISKENEKNIVSLINRETGLDEIKQQINLFIQDMFPKMPDKKQTDPNVTCYPDTGCTSTAKVGKGRNSKKRTKTKKNRKKKKTTTRTSTRKLKTTSS